MEARRMGRPPKTSREEILDAAARSDADDLQLTTLAGELGISVKTVYYYFPTRKALVDALTERAVAEMGLPSVAQARTWREVLTEAASWYYRLGLAQPGWFQGSAAPRGVGVMVVSLVQDRLTALGWTERNALKAHAVISTWAVSSGESAARTIEVGGLDADTIRGHLADYAEPATVDDLSRLMSTFSLEEMFEDGLKTLLAGIEATLL